MNIKTNIKPVLHQAHVFGAKERQEVIANNLAIDWRIGHREVIKKVLETHTELRENFEYARQKDLEFLRRNSLLLLVLFISGVCDANCEICYTDRKKSKEELDLGELKRVVDEATELGIKTVYIPGEGEPFRISYFFDLIDYICKEKGLNLVVFTNGILLSDEGEFEKYWNISLSDFIDNYVRRYNIFFYVKLWHIHPQEIEKLIGTKLKTEPYDIIIDGRHERIYIPNFLIKLIADDSLLFKAGIETAVFNENFDIVLRYLVPFVEQTGIKWYLEPILHAGRYFGKHYFDLNQKQEKVIKPLYNQQQCQRAIYTATVTSCGYVTFCPIFHYVLDSLRNIEYKKIMKNIKEEKLFEILHKDRFLVKLRYGTLFYPCLCEYFSSRLEQQSVQNYEVIQSIKII